MKKDIFTKHVLITSFFIICFSFIGIAQSNTSEFKTINGLITNQNIPLPNVNIIIKERQKGTKTNSDGYYEIQAKIGDIIQYSHVGFKSVTIIVEDVTQTLNIDMVTDVNQLDEAVVTARKPVKATMGISDKMHQEIETAVGKLNPMLLPTKVHYLEGNDIGHHYTSLTQALQGKFSGELPGIFDVDGHIYREEPPIDLASIIDIYIVKGLNGTMRWGGPVIIVRTMDNPSEIKKRQEEKAESYRNQSYYNNDAVTVNSDAVLSSTNGEDVPKFISQEKKVFGTISYLDKPLSNVNIKVENSTNGTKTDQNGQYELMTNIGDVIKYSFVGYKSVLIVVEDITSEINIDMTTHTNTLDEVVITAKTVEGKVMERVRKAEKPVVTSRGVLDPKRATYPVQFVDGEDIKPIYQTLTQALIGKMAGISIGRDPENGQERIMVKPFASINNPMFAIWDVDGQIFELEPPLDLNNIKSIHILKTLSATTKYGGAGTGGVVVVRTKGGTFDEKAAKLKETTEKHANQNYYANDALSIDPNTLVSNAHTQTLETFNNKNKAFTYYNKTQKSTIKEYSTHLSIAQKFYTYYDDAYLANAVLNDLADLHQKNPEILKSIAYQMQAMSSKKEAVSMYERIFKLRPNYAQSYRDLANAYKENDQFKKAWRMYMSYLMQGNDVSGEGIGELLYNEMEYLYFNRSYQTDIKQQFVPKNENKITFRNDVRFVVEWNTSEAEFDLEFVGPDKRAYVFEHNLVANQELITDEKLKGYSSKEFLIDDIGQGEWLMNIKYSGNKKSQPTYFKITAYYHWGKPNQRQEVQVYRFQNESDKIQLLKINKQHLVVSN